MQAAGAFTMKNKGVPHPNPPKDVSAKGMSMGSFRASLSKEGKYHVKSAGKPGQKKRARVKIHKPPSEGWNSTNLGRSYKDNK